MDYCSSSGSAIEGQTCSTASCAYNLLLSALFLIPISHYCIGICLICLVSLYNFFEIHFFEDVLSGFRGSPLKIVRNSSSDIYNDVVSKCKVLHGRYLATPWLSSPHLQTVFLNFFGRPPSFSYRRQIFHASDGGTIALDWVLKSDVFGGPFQVDNSISKDDTTPIVVVVPGLTSDSSSAYIKHLAFGTAKRGWNIVVSNHRGLGGMAVTSDCFYNAGWTEDTRAVLDYLHQKYPRAPLFAVGTSIGANILVKYLGEHGENVPIAGAVAICSPWDLLIGDRFICRKFVQKLYDRALAIGLQGYAQLHQPRYARLADWDGIKKSRSIRDFDNYATCLVGKFETVDTYYRRCSSVSYVGNVSVPLLCISALDDPLCTKEAIPWDECRANKNIVLVTSKHGGHLAFFEGIAASGLWWVRAVGEFLEVLHSSPYMHVQKKIPDSELLMPLGSSIDRGPYVNVADGMVAASGNQHLVDAVKDEIEIESGSNDEANGMVIDSDKDIHITDIHSTAQASRKVAVTKEMNQTDADSPVMRCLNQLSRNSRRSIWLLAYIAVVTSWPIVGSALSILFKGKPKNFLSGAVIKR